MRIRHLLPSRTRVPQPGRVALPVLLAALVVLATPGLGAAAQAESTEPPENASPSAAEILKRAAQAQGDLPEIPAGREPPLEIEMGIRSMNEKGRDVFVIAHRRYLPPHFLWTQLEDVTTGTVTIEGFDGRRGWLQKGDQVTLYEGAEYSKDREQLQRSIEDTSLFARVFFLRNLIGELQNPRRLPDESGYGRTSWVVEGDAEYQRGDEKVPLVLRLWVDRDNLELLGARVMEEGSVAQLCFTKHRRTDEGIVVPHSIEVYRDDQPKPSEKISVRKISFRPKLTPESFRTPARR